MLVGIDCQEEIIRLYKKQTILVLQVRGPFMAPLHNTQFRVRADKTYDKIDIRVIFQPR